MTTSIVLNGTYFITSPVNGASLMFANRTEGLRLSVHNLTRDESQQWLIQSNASAYTVKNNLYNLYISLSDPQHNISGVRYLTASEQPFGWYATSVNGTFTFSPSPALSEFWSVANTTRPANQTDKMILSTQRDLWMLNATQSSLTPILEVISSSSQTVPVASTSISASAAHSSSPMSTGLIVGIAVGGACAVILLVVVVMCACRRDRSYERRAHSQDPRMNATQWDPEPGTYGDFGFGPGAPPITY